jgi:hypothetical protein
MLSVLLTGCGLNAPTTPVYTATGSIGHHIDCSGLARNWGDCEQQAGAICKTKGYSILSKTDERQPRADGDTHISDLFTSTQVGRSMVIQCNGGDPA